MFMFPNVDEKTLVPTKYAHAQGRTEERAMISTF